VHYSSLHQQHGDHQNSNYNHAGEGDVDDTVVSVVNGGIDNIYGKWHG